MTQLRNISAAIAGSLAVLLFPAAGLAGAEPISTFHVSFAVGGADSSRAPFGALVDPVYGDATGAGAFSFSSALVPSGGGALIRASGLPVESLDFSFAGSTWTLANAGVTDLRFAPNGSLVGWAFGGAPFGFTGLTAAGIPDVGVVQPSFVAVIPQCCFNYTTNLNTQLGIFSGRLLSVSVTQTPGGDPSPVPEPGSMLLVGSGAVGLVARWRKRSASRDVSA